MPTVKELLVMADMRPGDYMSGNARLAVKRVIDEEPVAYGVAYKNVVLVFRSKGKLHNAAIVSHMYSYTTKSTRLDIMKAFDMIKHPLMVHKSIPKDMPWGLSGEPIGMLSYVAYGHNHTISFYRSSKGKYTCQDYDSDYNSKLDSAVSMLRGIYPHDSVYGNYPKDFKVLSNSVSEEHQKAMVKQIQIENI